MPWPGSAEVKVPAQYAVDGVQFAFRYVNTTHDTAPLAVDNVKLMAVRTARGPEVHHHRHRR